MSLTPRGKTATLELASYCSGTLIVLVLETLVLKYLVQVSHLMIATQQCLFSSVTFAPSRINTYHHCPKKGSKDLGRSQGTEAMLTSQGICVAIER